MFFEKKEKNNLENKISSKEEIADEILERINFSQLWQDEQQSDLIKFVPIISVIFNVIIIVILLIKK